MAQGISIDQASDLMQATLEATGPGDKTFQVTQQQPSYPGIAEFFHENRRVVKGGDKLWAAIQLGDSPNPQHTRLYATQSPRAANVDDEIEVKWTHATGAIVWDTRELSMNRGNKQRIYDYFKSRKIAEIRGVAQEVEDGLWSTPTSSTDDLNPHGLPVWLTYGADGGEGFVGYSGHYNDGTGSAGTPATTYNAGGIASSSSNNTRWASYWCDHEGNLDYSLLKKLSRALRKTRFTPPLEPEKIFEVGGPASFRLYTNDAVITAMEDMATKADDRIGKDLGKYAGRTIYKGIPFVYVPQLDTTDYDTYRKDPIIGVNHNHFYAGVLDGEYFRLGKPIPNAKQPNVLTAYYNLSYNYFCDNRREAGFLLSEFVS